MAKNFCENCGKKIEECTCEKDEVVEENRMLNDIKDIVKNIFKHPLDTMNKYTKKSKFNLGLVLIVINSIIFGIFGYIVLSDIYDSIVNSFILFRLAGEIEFKICILLMLLMLVYHFLFGSLLHYITTTILKKESDLKKTYALIGVNSSFPSICLIISLIAFLVNYAIGVICLIITFILYLISLYHGYVKLSKVDDELVIYIFTISFCISVFVAFYLLPKVLL